MDLDDLLPGIGPSRPLGRRAQRVVRVGFGLAVGFMGAAGAWHIATAVEGGAAMRGAGVAMFVALALFGLCGIALVRGTKLFGCLFLVSFAALFAVRILFGP